MKEIKIMITMIEKDKDKYKADVVVDDEKGELKLSGNIDFLKNGLAVKLIEKEEKDYKNTL